MKKQELFLECKNLLDNIENLQFFNLLKCKQFLQNVNSFLNTGDFEELLRKKNIHFKTEDGVITIDHEGFVSLDSLTQLPENTIFNNKGSVDLPSLTQLPENVQFNNEGFVSLDSLTQLPDNKEQIFKNDGIVYYNSDTKTYDPRNEVKREAYSFFVEGLSYRYFVYKGGNLYPVSRKTFEEHDGFKTILR